MWPKGPTRRYALGILVVAQAGGLLVMGVAVHKNGQVSALEEAWRRGLPRDFGPYLRAVLTRTWRERTGPLDDPASERTWAELDATLTRSFRQIPYLMALTVRLPDGRLALRVGQPPAGAPAGGTLERGEQDRVGEMADGTLVLDFAWTPPDLARESRDGVVSVQASFQVPDRPGERSRVTNVLMYGVLLLGVVIYLLAFLAAFMTRAQERMLNRARERGGRLRAVSKVAGGIAHEVRNPLNAISLMLQYLERKVRKTGEPPDPSDYARIHLELGKIRKVVDNFVKFARTHDLEVGDVDMGELVESVVASFLLALEEGGIRHEVEKTGDLHCTADRDKIREVLEAVIGNSLEAMREKEGGSLHVRVTGLRKEITVVVRDTGDLLDVRQVKSIFEPYFTTRDSALGLGMTVARTLVESHGGSIEADAAQGGGCVVTMTLPRSFF